MIIKNLRNSPKSSIKSVKDEKGNLILIEIHLDLGGDCVIEAILPRVLPYDFKELAVNMSVGTGVPLQTNSIKPVAVLYNEGEGLTRERGFQIISEESHDILAEKINDFIA